MAEFRGYQCDGPECTTVMEKDQRTRITTRYEGPFVQGVMVEDLCRECLPQDLPDLKPLPSRGKKSEEAESSSA